MQYWLLKSEPGNYSIQNFERDGTTAWTGVRNFQVRNYMQQNMRPGDLGLFYHSNSEPSGCVGILRVCGSAHADETQFDSKSKYFEPRATELKPVWFCVDVEFVAAFNEPVSLAELRANRRLKSLEILKKGSRLSITPVNATDFQEILNMAGYRRGKGLSKKLATHDLSA